MATSTGQAVDQPRQTVAALLKEHGRTFADEAGIKLTGDADGLRERLTEFPGIGPTGADIFLREVQAVWRDIAPFADRKVADGAKRLHLPSSAGELAALGPAGDPAPLMSALVRVARPQGR
jgi:3-methyladenine DNA glycosylase/8-oxoguanine DNA glycosylase